MRDLLGLYADPENAHLRKQIKGVRSVDAKQILRRVTAPGPIAFARGLEVGVLMDESSFEGTGVFLLGAFAAHKDEVTRGWRDAQR